MSSMPGDFNELSSTKTLTTTVRLWDGRDYDREFLAANCPALLEYAESHSTLRETMPIRPRDVAKRFLILSVAGYHLVFGWVAVWAGCDGYGTSVAIPTERCSAIAAQD
jgi:hypothetical protein